MKIPGWLEKVLLKSAFKLALVIGTQRSVMVLLGLISISQ